MINYYRLKRASEIKKRLRRLLLKRSTQAIFAVALALSWTFFSWPAVPFLPKIREAQAAIPTFVAAGAVATGTAAITVGLPAGIATNDILLLFLETSNQLITIATPNGGTWTQVTNSPQGTGTAATTTATRLTVFWSRYNGTQTAPVTSDSGSRQLGRMIAVRGVTTSGDPWDITSGGVDAVANTSGVIPGATTTVADTFVVAAIGTALPDATGTANFSAWANVNLASVTERTDNTSTSGVGGGLGIATGTKASIGAYGNTTVTLGASSVKAMMSIALKPPPPAPITDQSLYRWHNDDGNEAGATQRENTNTPATNVNVGADAELIRLRFAVKETNNASFALDSRIEFSSDASSCTTGSWTAMDTSSTAWRLVDSTWFTNDTNTTQRISSPDSWTAGSILDTANPDSTAVTIQNNTTEMEFAFKGIGASQSTTYRFRITDNIPLLDTYTNCGQASTEAAPGPTVDQVMRHGNWFTGGTEQGFFWAD